MLSHQHDFYLPQKCLEGVNSHPNGVQSLFFWVNSQGGEFSSEKHSLEFNSLPLKIDGLSEDPASFWGAPSFKDVPCHVSLREG